MMETIKCPGCGYVEDENELNRERQLRIGYQDTVYAVCLELDRALGNSPRRGRAVGSSKDEVIQALRRAIGQGK